MTSYVPVIKNGASGAIFYVSLSPQTPTGSFQSNPTLAAGDVKISIDGGSLSNLTTLPAVTPASSKSVKVTLSQSETNGDNLYILFSDAAGAEWCDLGINIQTVARQIDDLAFPNTSGRGIDVSTGGEVGLDWANIGSPTTSQNLSGTSTKALEPTTAGRTLDVSTGGEAGVDWSNVGAPTSTVNLSGTTIATSQVVASVSGAVGSVTGNVGGNVAGSVGSVIGNVGGNVVGTVASVVGNVGGNVVGTVASVVGNVGGNVTGSVGSVVADVSVGTMTSGALADFFTVDSGETYADAVAGSVVKEIADNANPGDLWATALPGAYSPGEAGYIVGTNLDDTVSSRLAPTVASRTLDVTATGAAGIDWGNVENPTTANVLSGTTISTSQVVASVTGSVGSVDTNGIAAASLATAAVSKIAEGVLTETDGVEDDLTLQQSQRVIVAAVAGVASGLGTPTAIYRNTGNTLDRITATTDADGNRISVTLDKS